MNTSPRRALLVIDVQNEYVTGQLRITYPDAQQSLTNIGRAMDAARAAGIPVVVVQQIAPAGAPIFAPGSNGVELHSTVAQREYDRLVTKSLPSALARTDLLEWLRGRAIDTVAVVGYMTQNCVASTVVQALHEGLAVEVLDDATGALPYRNSAGTVSGEEIHRVYNTVFQSRFAAVASTAQWCAAVAGGGQLPRDSIFNSHRNACAM